MKIGQELFCENGEKVTIRIITAESIIVEYNGKNYKRNKEVIGKKLFITNPAEGKPSTPNSINQKQVTEDNIDNELFVGRVLYDLYNNEFRIVKMDNKAILGEIKNVSKVTWNYGRNKEEKISYVNSEYNTSDIGTRIFFKSDHCNLNKQELMGQKEYKQYLSIIKDNLESRESKTLKKIKRYEPDNPLTSIQKEVILAAYYFKKQTQKEEDDFRKNNENGEYFARLDLDTYFHDFDENFKGHYYTKIYISNNPCGEEKYLDKDTVVWQIDAGLYSEVKGMMIRGKPYSMQISRDSYCDSGIVIDWRAPIANLFYDNKKTKLSIGKRYIYDYDLMLKRRFTEGRFSDLFVAGDNLYEEGTMDPFLMDIISENKNKHKLCDIIKTIQSNQNNIIRNSLNSNIIVQGCAGSGKTMIMLHRLSYLKYNNPTLNLDNIKILTPNELFNLHINEISKSLELDRIERFTVDKYYVQLLSRFDKCWGNYKDILPETQVNQDYVNYIYSNEFVAKFDNQYIKWSKRLYRSLDAIADKYKLIEGIRPHTSDKNKIEGYLRYITDIKQKMQEMIKLTKQIANKEKNREEIATKFVRKTSKL